jgi:hypothetical protein
MLKIHLPYHESDHALNMAPDHRRLRVGTRYQLRGATTGAPLPV